MRELYAVTWRATYEDRLGSSVVSDMVAQLSGPSVGGMVPADGQAFGAFSRSGQLIGAVIGREVRGVAYLWGMYVLPAYQRSGVGRRLPARAIAERNSARVIEVRVLKTSLSAQAFYEALGFTVLREENEEMFSGVIQTLLVMRLVRS
ncbi:GNAT family N-acetyltransferase [Aureimonas sp. D3]|uniref:GNAT family N-acetyltransferase n=1 Tax=Aureimonas sp. D3 TaxID=1638164 RepID=UPI000783A98C|nr:GNAT family N-acetyltransferase [Aureimonas sp. D3]